MKITPIDIRQQQFRRSIRGLDSREVDSFLNLVSDELETVLRENNRIKDDLSRTQRIVDEHKERERTLKETMITAQRITDDIKESARKEADVIISRAEIQAEKIIYAANDRLVNIIEDINEMKRQREQLRTTLTGVVESHRKLLHEFHEENAESLFISVEDLRQRRSRLHAQIHELLEGQADLLGLDRDRIVEDLREEVERLRAQNTNLFSRIQGAIDTHSKLLEAREEAETRTKSGQVEQTLRVLRKPLPDKNEREEIPSQETNAAGEEAEPAASKASDQK